MCPAVYQPWHAIRPLAAQQQRRACTCHMQRMPKPHARRRHRIKGTSRRPDARPAAPNLAPGRAPGRSNTLHLGAVAQGFQASPHSSSSTAQNLKMGSALTSWPKWARHKSLATWTGPHRSTSKQARPNAGNLRRRAAEQYSPQKNILRRVPSAPRGRSWAPCRHAPGQR